MTFNLTALPVPLPFDAKYLGFLSPMCCTAAVRLQRRGGTILDNLLEARSQGFKAAREGQPTSGNPYRNQRARTAWIGGYSEGRRTSESF
jgi:ribosome modulation factor